ASDGANATDSVYEPSLPAIGSATAAQGESTSTTSYSLSDASFSITFDQSVGAGQTDGDGLILFSPSVNIDYEISGKFTVTDVDGRLVDLYVFLFDDDAGIPLFDNYQQSLATPNESLTVGQSGGDAQNSLIGTLTGTLVAGTNYSFYAAAQLANLS